MTRPNSEEDAAEKGSIRGRILLSNGAPYGEPVKLKLQSFNGTEIVVYTDLSGQFDLGKLESGNYVLEAEADRQHFEPVSQQVQVFTGYPSVVTVTLKEKAGESKPAPPAGAGPTVSAGELEQKVPGKARKEFEGATRAAAAGMRDEAVARLQKAVEIFPDYLMARNDLGVQLMAAGRLEEAEEHLRHAVRLFPKAFHPNLNLGALLVRRQGFEEAAQVLETAISLNPRSAAARLHAGEAHAALGRHERAERELKTAYEMGGAEYAAALFHLGQLYLGRGERELALQSFETYLGVAPNAVNADQARALIKTLRQKTSSSRQAGDANLSRLSF
ncbi:MAG: tetratricopeptide repeat protein [Acidobacteria bacterium]|nr:tetratricopeptide repeat protein [Acidobacteriota bacterium]